MNRQAVTSLVLLCLLAFASPLLAGPQPAPVKTTLKRVALFKNGFAFFVHEGALTAEGRVVVAGPFAVPSHGTFWISAPSRAGLVSSLAREVTGSEDTPASEITDLLRGNIGRTVTVYTSLEPKSALTGKLLAFAPDRKGEPPLPYAMGQPLRGDIFPPPTRGSYFLLQTDDGVVTLPAYSVQRVDFPDGQPSLTFPAPVDQVQLEATFSHPTAGDWLSVSYLARGLTWAPSYLLDISDAKQAALSSKALIINEAEDLDGAHVDLITGFPHLQFADIASPIGMTQNLAQFLQSLAAGGSRAELASVITQNVAYAGKPFRGPAGPPGPMPEYGPAAAGTVAEDLFLYPLENVTLKKGETGYYPLFTFKVPYTQFYAWDIPDYINPEGYYRPQQGGDQEPPQEIVWHSLRVTNQTKLPWTTAPAQLMKDGQIIGQDTLNYTAPKAETVVKITQAVSVKAEQTEIEVSRERENVKFYGDYFDRVTIKGTLRVANYKDETIALEITKTLSGDVTQTDPKAEDVTLARGLKSMNPVHQLTWKLDLAAGQTREITYTYQALIRR